MNAVRIIIMVRGVIKNVLFFLGGQIGTKAVNFFYLLFLARNLGVAGFGQYVLALSWVAIFSTVSEFGLDRLVLRELSRSPEKRQVYLGNVIGLRLFLAVLAYLTGVFLIGLVGYSWTNFVNMMVLSLSLFPQTVLQAYTSVFNSQEKMWFSGAINFLLALLTAVVGCGGVKLYGLAGALVAVSVGLVLVLVLGVYLGKKLQLELAWEFDFYFWQRLLREAWPIGLLAILAMVYLRSNLTILARLTNDYLAGLYGSAFKLVDLGVVLPQALTLALFPAFSRWMIKDLGRLKKIYRRGLAVLVASSLPLVFLSVFFPRLIVFLIYGEDYLQAGSVLFVLSLALPFFFANALPANVILNSGQIKKFLPWEVLKILVNVGLCLFLIPSFSLVGAAWAMVVSEMIGFIINNFFVWKVLKG
jgi:O-antigen/teichoic acid export membrane protein